MIFSVISCKYQLHCYQVINIWKSTNKLFTTLATAMISDTFPSCLKEVSV